jgi:hypothetical protein
MQSHKSSPHSLNILTYCFTCWNRDWIEESFFCTRREEKKILLSLSSVLFSSPPSSITKVKRERKRRRFCNIFYLLSYSVTNAYIYLLICTLLPFLYDGHIRGFFVQVYDRPAYVKCTRISLHGSDQLQIHTYILWHDRETLYYQSMWKRMRPLVILYVYI